MENKNPMREIKVAKVVLNIGVGGAPEKVEKAYILAERMCGHKPLRTIATRRARTFRVRRNLPIGVKVTMRKQKGIEFLKKVMPAVDNQVKRSSFDDEGNFGFGIKEYLDIPGEKYDPKLGIIGMNVSVSLERPGYRIKRRKIDKSKICKSHRISQDEAVEFVKDNLGVKVIE